MKNDPLKGFGHEIEFKDNKNTNYSYWSKEEYLLVFEYSKCSSDEIMRCRYCHFPHGLRGNWRKNIYGETSTKFCGPRCFLLVC